jgi:putative transposase
VATQCRTFRYLLQPTERQKSALAVLLGQQCELYNAALEERRGAWRWERRSITYIDQCRTLTELRGDRPEMFGCGVTVCRGTLKRLDRAFGAFYRRCRTGKTSGFPRFKAGARFDSLQWEDTSGWKLDEAAKRLRLLGIGHVRVRLHRPLRGTPKAITVARLGRRWFVSLRCVDVPAQPLPATGRQVGIDLGVRNLVVASDGTVVDAGRHFEQASQELLQAQRALASKRRGSVRRRRAAERVGAVHRRVANRRKDLAHKVSRAWWTPTTSSSTRISGSPP